MKPNLDIESQEELTLVDWIRISGILIFVALLCFCVVLLAKGVNQPATTHTKAIVNASTPTGNLQPRLESNREAHAHSAPAITDQESHYIAFVSPSVQSSSKVPTQPIRRAQNRGATDKAIRGNRRNLVKMRGPNYRRFTVDAPGRSVFFEKGAPRSVEMLIEMWRRTSRTSKMALNESH
jgi:hypothetical protein